YKSRENNKEHRTDEISIKRLILRRGQEFHITVNFSQSGFNLEADRFVLIAETGLRPSHSAGTQVCFELLNSLDPNEWSATSHGCSSCELSLTINSSPNAKIGRYTLKLHDATEEQAYVLGEFVLLFNPWCSEDEVFLDNAEQREEYVMNETGIIFRNTYNSIHSNPWIFGQFEEDIVDICLKLLDLNPKSLRSATGDYERRNDAVYISRVVSRMVNSADDKGILKSRWNGPYYPETRPTQWIGSVDILRKWFRSNYQEVCFGQCWVFAAVACTVLRCLGIPTRVVTNFQSAHDTNGNLTIDNVVDEHGRTIRNNRDSIWNFHVWIEAWMARNDLKSGFDGWQVLDPTPQKRSEGVYCCGPSPVKAIKERRLNVKFDVPFVYAEVNADVVDWIFYRDGRKEKTSLNTTNVGRKISTKAVGSREREDITANYKYPEGEEQKCHDVVGFCGVTEVNNRRYVPKEKTFNLAVKTQESISIGKDVYAHVYIFNKSDKKIECNLNFSAEIIFLKIPSIDIKLLGEPVQYQKVKVEICIENPLLVPLKQGVLTFGGSGLIDVTQIRINEIKDRHISAVFEITPWKSGTKELLVDFDCDQIKDVKGSKIIVTWAKEGVEAGLE
ncbi:protein-glutamine gamma-glutamyltransferase 2-like, partial [Callorhinchus milii]|uniref:protein-glutamine gamma-glutamyltransferase 2-like n=1 Tax=Callorhinchus milii TaxID=7868 RepID=UPI001C3F6B6B